MKIKICNLGVIQAAEIELRPLTVFIGHNSEGKTWTAQACSAILSPYGHTIYVDHYVEKKVQQGYSP